MIIGGCDHRWMDLLMDGRFGYFAQDECGLGRPMVHAQGASAAEPSGISMSGTPTLRNQFAMRSGPSVVRILSG